jgi:hypothetical protein
MSKNLLIGLKPKSEIVNVLVKMFEEDELEWRKVKFALSNKGQRKLDDAELFQRIMLMLRTQFKEIGVDDIPPEALPVKKTRKRKQRSDTNP